MTINDQIQTYLASLNESKRLELEELHRMILQIMPNTQLWFLDGKDETGKVVSNPNIGYGQLKLKYADGKTKDFYQIGISANTSGISVYFMGIKDKSYLQDTYGKRIGNAKVTGYCIKFKSLKAIDMDVLLAAIADGVEHGRFE